MEFQKLKEKLQEYEETIKKQADEITSLRQKLNTSFDYSKYPEKQKKHSPKSSGLLQKRIESTFFKKESDSLRKEDLDFWKINEEDHNKREPQRLEDIAALKDLWIYNMETGPSVYKQSTKRMQGVKPNPLTRHESYQKATVKAKVLPKISAKRDNKEVNKK